MYSNYSHLSHCCKLQHLGCAHNYPTVSAAKAAITSLGREIQYGLLPDNIGPMIFTFTGAGNVSQVGGSVGCYGDGGVTWFIYVGRTGGIPRVAP